MPDIRRTVGKGYQQTENAYSILPNGFSLDTDLIDRMYANT
jgi:hypothetical protein